MPPPDADPPLSSVVNAGPLPTALVGGTRHRFTLPFELVNSGNAVAREAVTLNVYASADATPDSTDGLAATLKRVVVVKPGRTIHLSAALPGLPATLADGNYHLLVQLVDAMGYGQFAASAATVDVAAPFVSPALSFARPPPALTGRGGSVAIAIANHGNVPAAGPVTVTLFLAPTAGDVQSVPADAVQVTTLTRRLTVPGGRTTTVSVPVRTFPPLPPASYHWVVRGDDHAARHRRRRRPRGPAGRHRLTRRL